MRSAALKLTTSMILVIGAIRFTILGLNHFSCRIFYDAGMTLGEYTSSMSLSGRNPATSGCQEIRQNVADDGCLLVYFTLHTEIAVGIRDPTWCVS